MPNEPFSSAFEPQNFQTPPENTDVFSQPQNFPEPPPLRTPQYKRAVHRYNLDWWLLIIGAIIAVSVIVNEVGSIPSLNWFYVQAYNAVSRIRHAIFPDDYAFKKDVSLQVLTSKLSGEGNEAVLHVKCEVVNNSETQKFLPEVSVSLMDKGSDGDLVLRTVWEHKIPDMPINPGERRIFETSGPCLKDTLPETVKVAFREK